MKSINIVIYATATGKQPFVEWVKNLDKKTQFILASRLDRLRIGNFGDSKQIKGASGMKELRIDYGSGYRIYFGMQTTTIVILLLGGDKKSQNRDIEKAKKYWLECKEKLL